ncbi:MAG: MarR family transcriptional regulator [Pseudomonadota bacterium]
MNTDLIDRLIEEWQQEQPAFDTNAMHVVGRIMRLGRAYETEAARVLESFDLSYTEFDIVATLRRSGKPYQLTPGALARTVLLTSGAMTAALDRLESKELIVRVASDTDRRVRAAKLTRKGARQAIKASAARFATAEDAVASLTGSQRAALTGLLKTLMAQPGSEND